MIPAHAFDIIADALADAGENVIFDPAGEFDEKAIKEAVDRLAARCRDLQSSRFRLMRENRRIEWQLKCALQDVKRLKERLADKEP